MNADQYAVCWIPNDPDRIGGVCNDNTPTGNDNHRVYDTVEEAEAEREKWHAQLGQQKGQYRVVAFPRPALQDFLV